MNFNYKNTIDDFFFYYECDYAGGRMRILTFNLFEYYRNHLTIISDYDVKNEDLNLSIIRLKQKNAE